MRFLASLTNRIFLASSLLAVISIAVAVFVVNARVTAEAEAGLRRGLEDAAMLVGNWQATLSENYQLAARLIADSPRLKAAIDTGDPRTVEPLADEFRRETKADVLIITDRLDEPLSVLGRWVPDARPPRSVAGEADERGSVTYWAHPDGVLQLVTVPVMVGPQRLGAVSVGFVFDRGRAGELHRMTDSGVGFAVGGRVVASTVDRPAFPAVEAMLGRPGMSEIVIGGDEYVSLARPFAVPGAESVVFQSRTERLRFLREIHAALAVTALLSLIGAVGLSYLVARTVTRPLAAITSVMREVASTGDLTRKVTLPAGHWEDEDARLLAGTFNTLTDSIARSQREAAQRERLSSLGRLSTVIAHEIRNPLMIIKASVRAFRRDPLEAAAVREAASDIAEEVDRLDGIVSGVLDFARPIRFDIAPADIRLVCAESIAAATADGLSQPVPLRSPRDVPALRTDAERLRGVLVNLIANAQQAVAAPNTGPTPATAHAVQVPADRAAEPAGVEVSIEVLAPRRVAIEVRDRGIGIPAGELAKVFEPFFTTRRGGTGLGLAIARNVIDGLGGAISISSREGIGTIVRVELTDAA